MMRVYRCAMTVAILLVVVAAPVQAQNPSAPPVGNNGTFLDPLPIKPDLQEKQKRQRELKMSAERVLRGTGAFDEQGRADMVEWYTGFIFPAMTNPDYFDDLGKMRVDITKDLQNAKQAPVHDFVVSELFKGLRPLVEANYPPPTRVNALLLISELNQVERGAGGDVATPHPSVLPYLREQLNNPNQIDGVRLVALAGIHRHVESQWWATARPADDWINGLQQEMLAIVTAADPPGGRSPDAHAWFRGRAADVLGSLAGWAPNEASFKALSDILADQKAPISLRCRAAYALGRIDYKNLPSANSVKLEALTGNIAGLLADACKVELTSLNKQREKVAGGSNIGGSPGLGGEGAFNPTSMMAPGGSMQFGAGGGKSTDSDEEDSDRGTSSGNAFGSGPSGPSGGAGGPAATGPQTGGVPPYLVDGARRRLLYELACVQSSVVGPDKTSDFKGLKALATNNATATGNLKDIESEISKLNKELIKKNYKLDGILKEVRSSMQKLDRIRPQVAAESNAANDIPDASDIPAADNGNAAPAQEDVPADMPPTNEVAPATGGRNPGR